VALRHGSGGADRPATRRVHPVLRRSPLIQAGVDRVSGARAVPKACGRPLGYAPRYCARASPSPPSKSPPPSSLFAFGAKKKVRAKKSLAPKLENGDADDADDADADDADVGDNGANDADDDDDADEDDDAEAKLDEDQADNEQNEKLR